jgi:hypothetical protein
LRVTLPLGREGTGVRRPELVLRAEVEPLVAFDPPLTGADVSFGEAGLFAARLTGRRAAGVRLTPGSPLPKGFSANVIPGGDGAPARVDVRVAGLAVGRHAGTLSFATGLDAPATVGLGYLVDVRGTLTLDPTNPTLDLAGPGERSVTIEVRSSRPGFVVRGADVLDGPFAASVERRQEGYAVHVRAVEGGIPEGARGATGRVRIRSNDASEPEKVVSVLGYGTSGRPRR